MAEMQDLLVELLQGMDTHTLNSSLLLIHIKIITIKSIWKSSSLLEFELSLKTKLFNN